MQRVVERLFAGVAKGGMADVVGQGEGLGEFGVQAKSVGDGAGDLGDFECVGQAAAEMVAGEVARQVERRPGFFRRGGGRRAHAGCGRGRARKGIGRDGRLGILA